MCELMRSRLVRRSIDADCWTVRLMTPTAMGDMPHSWRAKARVCSCSSSGA